MVKSKAARLLERMSSVEKKVVYDVNGAEEVTDNEQKKMGKPCKCCSESRIPVSAADKVESLIKDCKPDLDLMLKMVESGLNGDPLAANQIRNQALGLKKKVDSIISMISDYVYSNDTLKRAQAIK